MRRRLFGATVRQHHSGRCEEGQDWWLLVVRDGVQERNELEVKLRLVEETDRLEEWWVTKTVRMQEVRSELQQWIAPAKKPVKLRGASHYRRIAVVGNENEAWSGGWRGDNGEKHEVPYAGG